ncbi:peptidylprolyl isomerase [candidate division WOR-3 bacterium]|nr:peptidylprolyl isomerase [candidate division WOR-3 bacterium]
MKIFSTIFLFFLLSASLSSANADEIISIVEKEAVTRTELETYMKTSIFFIGGFELPNKRLQEEFEKERYENLLNIYLVLNSGDTTGILDVSPEAVEEEFMVLLGDLAYGITGDSTMVDSISAYFSQAGIDWILAKELLRKEFYFKIAAERYVSFSHPDLTNFDNYWVSEDILRELYEEIKDSLSAPVAYSFSRIVLMTIPSEKWLMEVNSKAATIMQALSSGEDFRTLASIYSDDSEGRANGGYLGIVKRGELNPEVENAIFSIETGTAGFAQSPAGLHVLYVPMKWADSAKVYEIFISLLPKREDTLKTLADLDEVMKLLHDGTPFEEVAKRYSNDQFTKDDGGFLENVPAESLDVSLRSILDMLQPGEFTEPIPSPFGFIVLKLEGVVLGEQESYESFKDRIKEIHLLRERQTAIEKWLEELENSLYVWQRDSVLTNEN